MKVFRQVFEYNLEVHLCRMEKQYRRKPIYRNEMGFILFHLTPLLIFYTGATAFDWWLMAGLYFFRMFFITGGYHRYFSHNTYSTSRVFQFILAFFAQTSMQKGALWWASNHRIHHKHSDTPEDPHSANLYGFWYAHVGWILGPEFKETRYDLIRDFAKYKELQFLNRFHLLPVLFLAVCIYLTGNMVNGTGLTDWSAGLSTFAVAFCLGTVLLFHGTFTINSLMHLIGSRRYKTTDKSRNNFILALLTMGEGWHNNHHYFQSTAKQGFFWWEVDITYYILKMLSWCGIVWNLRGVPDKMLHSNLEQH